MYVCEEINLHKKSTSMQPAEYAFTIWANKQEDTFEVWNRVVPPYNLINEAMDSILGSVF